MAGNWEIRCVECNSLLPYERVMEQKSQGGNLSYIEEEVGLICRCCMAQNHPDHHPTAKPR